MDKEIAEQILKDTNLLKFDDLREWPNPYVKSLSLKNEKAHPRQRGYIHGMSKKLGIDDNIELPYIVKDVRKLDVEMAAEVIQILKDLIDNKNAMF